MKRPSRKWYLWALLGVVIFTASASGTYFVDACFFRTERPVTLDACSTEVCTSVHRKFLPHESVPYLRLASIEGGKNLDLTIPNGQERTVLVFSSFSCTVFQERMHLLEEVYQRYKDLAKFAFVVTPEAGHKIPGYEFLLEDVQDIIAPGFKSFPFIREKREPDGTTRTRAERVLRAMRKAKFSLPAFLDSPGQEATQAYFAYPGRMMIINADGTIQKDFGNILWREWDMAELARLLEDDRPELSRGADSIKPTPLPRNSSPMLIGRNGTD